jgi:hypothetical protein
MKFIIDEENVGKPRWSELYLQLEITVIKQIKVFFVNGLLSQTKGEIQS